MDKPKCDEQVDYRKMYYHMAAEMDKAIRLLIAAQRACEDMLLEGDDIVDTGENDVPHIPMKR